MQEFPPWTRILESSDSEGIQSKGLSVTLKTDSCELITDFDSCWQIRNWSAVTSSSSSANIAADGDGNGDGDADVDAGDSSDRLFMRIGSRYRTAYDGKPIICIIEDKL